MGKHTFKLTISGTEEEATAVANALASMAKHLESKMVIKLGEVAQHDKQKVALARQFLGV